MNSYIKLIFSALALCVLFSSCENEEIISMDDIQIAPPSATDVIYVEPDDGVTSVNNLTNSIAANGAGTYILRRGGIYFLEGKNVISNNVVIKAEDKPGKRPVIQPICDEQGAINADIIVLQADVAFKDIIFIGKDAATGNLAQRIFKVNTAGIRLSFDNCFVNYCRNFMIRTDAPDSKIYMRNSTFRNLALANDPANGRLIDGRGNAVDSAVVHNCFIYNTTGHTLRFDSAIWNYVEFSNNTFYNVGYHMEFKYAINILVENNIFANTGWKSSSTSDTFWAISKPKGDNGAKCKVTIRNNNRYFDSYFEGLFAKYPQNLKRMTLSSDAQKLMDDGQMIYENNFEEPLAFDYPPKTPTEWMDLYFSVVGADKNLFGVKNIYVWEGDNTIDSGDIEEDKVFTFNYPSSSKSSTASTTGSPIGAIQL